jgi:very-short-patch-repair endonuclease
MSLKNPKQTRQLRRDLRQNMTEAEGLLWQRIRNKKLCGVRVKRQYGIGPYILDFYVPKSQIAIEVDGKIHLKKEQQERDLNKDTFLTENGIRVVRFTNEEVLNNIEQVILNLESMINEKLDKQ